MELLVASRWGPPAQVCRLTREARPDSRRAPAPNELGLEILAAPIHPLDQLRARGLYALPLALPGIPGSEGVARVTELGSKVQGWKRGDLCLLPLRFGSYRSYARLKSDCVYRLPKGIDPVQASMLIINPLSADLLLEQSQLQPGDSFLNLPASGAVGQSLICLARSRGMESINLVRSTRWQSWLSQLDPRAQVHTLDRLARQRINYQAHAAFDGVGGDASAQVARHLRASASLFVYGAASKKTPRLGLNELIFGGVQLRGFWLHRWMQAQTHAQVQARIDALAAQMQRGALRMKVAALYPLSAYQEAFAVASSPQTMGKVLFTPQAK